MKNMYAKTSILTNKTLIFILLNFSKFFWVSFDSVNLNISNSNPKIILIKCLDSERTSTYLFQTSTLKNLLIWSAFCELAISNSKFFPYQKRNFHCRKQSKYESSDLYKPVSFKEQKRKTENNKSG